VESLSVCMSLSHCVCLSLYMCVSLNICVSLSRMGDEGMGGEWMDGWMDGWVDKQKSRWVRIRISSTLSLRDQTPQHKTLPNCPVITLCSVQLSLSQTGAAEDYPLPPRPYNHALLD